MWGYKFVFQELFLINLPKMLILTHSPASIICLTTGFRLACAWEGEMRTNIVFLVIILLHLAGCTAQNLKSDKPSPSQSNIAQLEQKAREAYQNEDWETSEEAYKNLTLQTPDMVEPWFRLGNIYAQTNRLDAAVTAYREALTLDPENTKVWHNLGVIQLRQAANTFLEMRQHTEENDPLGLRARNAINSIANLINTDFQPEDEH
jgi:tetratricopeptide (TPR) repeat protein